MAKVYYQSHEYKTEFLKRIEAKQNRREHEVRQRVEAAVPQWAGWFLKPLATGMVRSKQRRDSQQGAGGEFSVGLHLWARLSKEWAVINDVVLEYQLGEYSQLDHVVIGPPGVFLVETKAWTGPVLLKNDRCFRKQAGRWVPANSPVGQQKAHLRRFHQWYGRHGLPNPVPPVSAIVVFTRSSWLRSDGCSIPVLTPTQAVAHMRRAAGQRMNAAEIEDLAHHIATPKPVSQVALGVSNHVRHGLAPPLEQTSEMQIVEGITRAGRKYVRIRGSREASQEVWERYGKPGKLAADRYQNGVFFFYCD